VHHRLFVARLVVGEHVGVLRERLSDPGQVAVTEDAEAAFEQSMLHAIALRMLRGQKAHQGLGGGETHDAHLPEGLPITAFACPRQSPQW
jgi:hypothetical protein